MIQETLKISNRFTVENFSRSQSTGSRSKSSIYVEPRPKHAIWYMEFVWERVNVFGNPRFYVRFITNTFARNSSLYELNKVPQVHSQCVEVQGSFSSIPHLQRFSCWKIRFKTQVSSCSDFPSEGHGMDQRSGDGRFCGWIKIFAIKLRVRISRIWKRRTREALLLGTRSSIILTSRKRSVWRNRKPRKRIGSFVEDRSLAWSTTTFESLVLMMLFLIVLIYFDDVQELDTRWDEIFCQWPRSPLMMFWKVWKIENTMRPDPNSNDFSGFWNELADSNSIFVVAEIFLNDSNFWCVQSSITHTMWPYMCMCCGLFAPTHFHFECCGACDDSWWHVCIYVYIFRDVCKTWNHCGRSKASLTEHHGKCLTCKSFVILGFGGERQIEPSGGWSPRVVCDVVLCVVVVVVVVAVVVVVVQEGEEGEGEKQTEPSHSWFPPQCPSGELELNNFIR